jgi:hypothetical protein
MSPRDRDAEAQWRRLLALRSGVLGALTAPMPAAGRAATLDAIDEALAQLVAVDADCVRADELQALWSTLAQRRLVDEACCRSRARR